MVQVLKDYIEAESGYKIASVTENKTKVDMSFMRQIVTLMGVTYVIRMTHLLDGRLDIFYYIKEKNNES